MSRSGSSGRVPYKTGKIPYELKNQKEWDPSKKKPEYESDDDSEESYNEDEDEFIHVPYVSGGTSIEQDPPSQDKPSEVVRSKNNAPTKIVNNNFQRVTPKQPSRVPPKVRNISAVQNEIRKKMGNAGKFNLGYNKDNTARAAYRKRLPHSATFSLDRDCDKIFSHPRNMYDYFEELGVRNKSFIRPPQHAKDRELRIWGSSERVGKTIAELREYLVGAGRAAKSKSSMKPAGKENFSKENSAIGHGFKQKQNQMLKQALIQDFQRVPESGRTYGFTGAFLWPVEEVSPEELLGGSLEALDTIRFQFKCHIVFDNHTSAFKIFTNDPGSVEKTMLRITGIMKEYTAKFTTRNSRRIVDYVIELPSPSTMRKDVKILPGPTTNSAIFAGKIPLLTGKVLEREAYDSWITKSKLIKVQNSHRIEQNLCKAIQLLPYYRGKLRMRIQYGTFELTTLRWPENTSSMPFQDFMMNLGLAGTKGRMLRDLQVKKDAATIMSKVHDANGLFEPLDHSTFELEDVVPSFSACFTFRESDGPTYQLDVGYDPDPFEDRMHNKTHSVWTKPDRRDNSTVLGVYKIQIDGGSSWMLHILNEKSVDKSRITPRMEEFANSVTLKKSPPGPLKPTGHKMFQWKKDIYGIMVPRSFEQKTSYKYRLKDNNEYVFEIARYDVYGDPKDENTPVHTSWAASLYNREWDAIFADNSERDIGQSAHWDPRLATFFPAHGSSVDKGADPGVVEFLSTVDMVTAFADSIKKQAPHLRQ